MLKNTLRYHYKTNLHLALPIVFSNIAHVITALADTLMVGRLGATPLAAVSLGSNVYSVFLVSSIGLSLGITPLGGQAFGRGDYKEIPRLFFNGQVLYLSIVVTLTLLLYWLAPFLHKMDQPSEVVNITIPYFRLLLISMIPLMVYQGSKQLAEGLRLTKVAMYVSVGANLLNVLLNYLLIFGKLGFPALGLNGAGWATIIARTVMGIAMTIYLFLPQIKKAYPIRFRCQDFSINHQSQLFRLGLPIGLQLLFEVSAFSGATLIVGWIGAKALAAHQIALTMAMFTYMAANGMAAAATVRVSHHFGSGDFSQIRQSAFSVYHLTGAFMLLCGIGFVTFRFGLPSLFIDDPAVMALATQVIIIAAFFQLSDGFQVTGLSALRGLSDVKIPTAITVLAYWLIGLPTGYLLGIKSDWGLTGVWIGLLIGLSTAAILLTLRFHLKTVGRGQVADNKVKSQGTNK